MGLKSAENLQFFMFHETLFCALKFANHYPWFGGGIFLGRKLLPAWTLYFSPVVKSSFQQSSLYHTWDFLLCHLSPLNLHTPWFFKTPDFTIPLHPFILSLSAFFPDVFLSSSFIIDLFTTTFLSAAAHPIVTVLPFQGLKFQESFFSLLLFDFISL